VSQSLFITVLAVLTAIAGTALVMMLLRRRRRARVAEARAKALAEKRAKDAAAERRRTIDDYAIPVGFDSRPGADDEPDVGKICPACGARYASHHRFCQRCNDSELAALN
jgi:hypothetical protein